jgi:hypothetical protein
MGTVCCGGDAYIGGGVSPGPCAACPASRRLSIAKRLHSLRILIWIEICQFKLSLSLTEAEAKERHHSR